MSESLFELVKSVTLSEKGYFKRVAIAYAGKENKNYIRIYSVIEKSKKFDDYLFRSDTPLNVLLIINYRLHE